MPKIFVQFGMVFARVGGMVYPRTLNICTKEHTPHMGGGAGLAPLKWVGFYNLCSIQRDT